MRNFVTSLMQKKAANNVASPTLQKTWATIPASDYVPPKYTGPSYQRVMKMRKDHCSPAAFTLYKEPLLIVEGQMQYIYYHTGRKYLDIFAGVATSGMGHCHPRITAKIKE